jgi:hypothetical protein
LRRKYEKGERKKEDNVKGKREKDKGETADGK